MQFAQACPPAGWPTAAGTACGREEGQSVWQGVLAVFAWGWQEQLHGITRLQACISAATKGSSGSRGRAADLSLHITPHITLHRTSLGGRAAVQLLHSNDAAGLGSRVPPRHRRLRLALACLCLCSRRLRRRRLLGWRGVGLPRRACCACCAGGNEVLVRNLQRVGACGEAGSRMGCT